MCRAVLFTVSNGESVFSNYSCFCSVFRQYKSTRRLDEEVTEGAELVSFAPNGKMLLK